MLLVQLFNSLLKLRKCVDPMDSARKPLCNCCDDVGVRRLVHQSHVRLQAIDLPQQRLHCTLHSWVEWVPLVENFASSYCVILVVRPLASGQKHYHERKERRIVAHKIPGAEMLQADGVVTDHPSHCALPSFLKYLGKILRGIVPQFGQLYRVLVVPHAQQLDRDALRLIMPTCHHSHNICCLRFQLQSIGEISSNIHGVVQLEIANDSGDGVGVRVQLLQPTQKLLRGNSRRNLEPHNPGVQGVSWDPRPKFSSTVLRLQVVLAAPLLSQEFDDHLRRAAEMVQRRYQ
mmetsp:Transcript_60997/g.163624  ORF Transcript_60997/g.163624 Transcript_60997/m.163624 type:complete len:289 (-) Transcript_60997:211-1077(-)